MCIRDRSSANATTHISLPCMHDPAIKKETMIRLLAAVMSPKNPFFHSLQTDSRIQTLVLPNRKGFQYFSQPGSSYRCHPTNTLRSGSAQLAKRERLGFPENLRGARTRRIRHRKSADCAPPPEEQSKRSFASRGHESRGDPRSRTGFQCGQFINLPSWRPLSVR